MFFGFIFVIVAHILACFWVISLDVQEAHIEASIAGSLPEVGLIKDRFATEGSWIASASDLASLEVWGMYTTALYFTVSTITTVGYGDFHAESVAERSLGVLIMFIGVISFSFATGSLASILQNYDHANAKL